MPMSRCWSPSIWPRGQRQRDRTAPARAGPADARAGHRRLPARAPGSSYGRYWRKSAREPGAERELAAIALERLEKLQLVVRDAGAVRPLPALARFALGEAEVREAREVRQPRPAARCSDRHERPLDLSTRRRTGRRCRRRRGSAGSRCGWAWSSCSTTTARNSGSATAICCCAATTAPASRRCCR